MVGLDDNDIVLEAALKIILAAAARKRHRSHCIMSVRTGDKVELESFDTFGFVTKVEHVQLW